MLAIEENVKERIRKKPEFIAKFILMVDDDPLTNFMNKKLMVHMGANAIIKTFDNGIDALAEIDKLNVPGATVAELCILLDLQMVEMDGIEFLERLRGRKLCVNLRVFIVSGSLPVDRLQQLQSFSLEGFFLKPLSKGNVREVLMPVKPVYFNRG